MPGVQVDDSDHIALVLAEQHHHGFDACHKWHPGGSLWPVMQGIANDSGFVEVVKFFQRLRALLDGLCHVGQWQVEVGALREVVATLYRLEKDVIALLGIIRLYRSDPSRAVPGRVAKLRLCFVQLTGVDINYGYYIEAASVVDDPSRAAFGDGPEAVTQGRQL